MAAKTTAAAAVTEGKARSALLPEIEQLAEQNRLALFERLMKTDPKYTKPFKKGGGFSGTAINATSTVMKLTQEFGPAGWGWGYIVTGYRDVWPDPAYKGSDGKPWAPLNFCDIVFWYFPGGRLEGFGQHSDDPRKIPGCAWFSQVGGTEYTGRADDEVCKKSLTDAITKAASHIGANADIHLGLFDDSKYVDDRKAEVANEAQVAEAVKRDAERAKLEAERRGVVTAVELLEKQFAECHDDTTLAELRQDMLKLTPQLQRLDMKAEFERLKQAGSAAAARVKSAPAA
jgi:hypothetical protein